MLKICLCIAILCLSLVQPVLGQVQLTTVPGRDAVEITIYKNADLTLVREQRHITLKGGVNLIQFNWADTRIDPTSLQLKPLRHTDTVAVKYGILPPNQPNLMRWEVEAKGSVEETFEVSYFISGIRWYANYIAVADSDEKQISLTGFITIANESGEDFEKAATRLVVGKIHLVESIGELADKVMAAPQKEARMALRATERAIKPKARPPVAKKAISEYYLYTIKDLETIKYQWQNRFQFLEVSQIPIEVVYRFDGSVVKRFYKFKNDESHKLGEEPLPSGNIQIFRRDAQGSVVRLGETHLPFVSKGAEVELELGVQPEVKVERKLFDFARVNLQFNKGGRLIKSDTEREVKFEIRNYSSESITLEIFEHIGGAWEMLKKSHDYILKDANTIQFTLSLKAGDTETITYRALIK